MNLVDYRKKLGLAICDEKKVELFLSKAYMAFSEAIQLGQELSPSQFNNYCFNAGIKVEPVIFSGYVDNWYKVFQHLMEATSDLKTFLYYYTVLLNSAQKDSPERKSWIKALKYWASQSELEFELYESGEDVFIFPKGAKELDDALVSEPLEWLSEYPVAYKTYCIALKQYSDGLYIRDVADNFRKALEAFLQEFLGNSKNLETNKNDICKYLGEHGVDAGIAGLFHPLISAYKNINDRIAKHNDAVDARLLEFLMHQTGILIRMVIIIKKSEV